MMQPPYITPCISPLCITSPIGQVNETDPEWGDESVALALPHGQSRPALFRIMLWDDDCKTDDDALATTDWRATGDGASGSAAITLVGVGRGNKSVDLTFDYTLVDDI